MLFLVVLGLLLQGIDHCSGTFLFLVSFSYCLSAVCIRNTSVIALLQRLGVFGISAILIYTLYLKKYMTSKTHSAAQHARSLKHAKLAK